MASSGLGDAGGKRDAARDSMFLQAELRPIDGRTPAPFRVRVRNLSAGGLMAECHEALSIDDRIAIEVRNIGTVEGTIAWVRSPRFGVTFDRPVDPRRARQPLGAATTAPAMSAGGYYRA